MSVLASLFALGLMLIQVLPVPTHHDTASGRDVYFGRDTRADAPPCAACHGIDGRGNMEGGTVMPAIRDLIGSARAEKPVYASAGALCSLLRHGRRSNGANVSRSMPKYPYSAQQCRILFDYLDQRNIATAEGVTADSILISLTIHEGGRTHHNWQDAFTEEINRANTAGGIFGRRIHTAPHSEAPALVHINLRSANASAAVPALIRIDAESRQDESGVPYIRQIASNAGDQLSAVLAHIRQVAGSGQNVYWVDGAALGPARDTVAALAGDHGLTLTATAACPPPGNSRHILVQSVNEQNLAALLEAEPCSANDMAFFALQGVNLQMLGLRLGDRFATYHNFVYAPVPPDALEGDGARRLARIIVDALRRTGAGLTEAAFLAAFDAAWHKESFATHSMYRGAFVQRFDLKQLRALEAGGWVVSP